MKDIENKADITLLVNRFYQKVIDDAVIGHIFTKVAHFDWAVHIPIMVSFWESLLFGTAGYKGNTMLKHTELDKLLPLQHHHFIQWLTLWQQTVQENFDGKIAGEAIAKAKNIASLMQVKIAERHN